MRKGTVKLLALAAILFLAAAIAVNVDWQRLGLVTPGWEIYNQISALEYQDVIYKSASQFTSPKELKGVYWKVDVDDPEYGVATLMIEVSDIRHVDFSGRETPNNQPASYITVTRGNYTYYLDYHIYMYTVTIRTVADKKQYAGVYPWTVPQFKHETSFPYEGYNGLFGGVGSQYIGKRFQGGVYTKFAISPWRGGTYRETPTGYILDKCWAGVMNTYVFQRKTGQVENQWGTTPATDPKAPMWVKAGLDEGNQVPMFADDGTFGTPITAVKWDPSVTPDTRIASTVVHYLPVELFPGAYVTLDWAGISTDITPCDVYVQYTLRVDVLQVHSFVLQTSIHPPSPSPPTDWFTWVKSFWEQVAEWFANPANQFWIVIIMIFIIMALITIFAPWIWALVIGLLSRKKG